MSSSPTPRLDAYSHYRTRGSSRPFSSSDYLVASETSRPFSSSDYLVASETSSIATDIYSLHDQGSASHSLLKREDPLARALSPLVRSRDNNTNNNTHYNTNYNIENTSYAIEADDDDEGTEIMSPHSPLLQRFQAASPLSPATTHHAPPHALPVFRFPVIVEQQQQHNHTSHTDPSLDAALTPSASPSTTHSPAFRKGRSSSAADIHNPIPTKHFADTFVPSGPRTTSYPVAMFKTPPAKIIKAMADYSAKAANELSFRCGDFFYVASESHPRLYEVVNPSSKARGHVPKVYFETLEKSLQMFMDQDEQIHQMLASDPSSRAGSASRSSHVSVGSSDSRRNTRSPGPRSDLQLHAYHPHQRYARSPGPNDQYSSANLEFQQQTRYTPDSTYQPRSVRSSSAPRTPENINYDFATSSPRPRVGMSPHPPLDYELRSTSPPPPMPYPHRLSSRRPSAASSSGSGSDYIPPPRTASLSTSPRSSNATSHFHHHQQHQQHPPPPLPMHVQQHATQYSQANHMMQPATIHSITVPSFTQFPSDIRYHFAVYIT
ncbi:bud emergence protein 1, partial [Podochytrium sp. JEL0797]